MVRYVFDDEHVTSDEIYAVGAAFTVVAWAFAYVYSGAQVVWPGSSPARAGRLTSRGSTCSSSPSPR